MEFAIRDPRTGRYFASHTSGFYGPRLMYADDPTGEWTQAEGPSFPEGGDTALERIWTIMPGEADGLLYAGVAPGGAVHLDRRRGDVVAQRVSVEGARGRRLAARRRRAGAALDLPVARDPDRLAVGVSAAGVWLTEDGGQTWRTGYEGLVPEYMPEEAREGTNVLCVHNMHRAPTRPERLFMQFHGNVYRSDDEGSSWSEIRHGLPSGFGFPLVIDPADPDSAFVIPLVADVDRVTPEGRVRVFETRDAGATWTERGEGLPADEAYLTVLRQAFGSTAGAGPGAVLRRDERRRVRLSRRRRLVVPGAGTARAGHERARRLIATSPAFERPSHVRPRAYGSGMAQVISLDDYRSRRKGPLAQAIERLDRAVARLDPLVHDRTGRLAPSVERELALIARDVGAARPLQAAIRAERLADLLEHPAASG